MQSQPYFEEHGGIDPQELRRLSISSHRLLDFSVNSNPFGPSPRVLEAIHRVDISCYPDRNCLVLRERLADLNDVPVNQILIGNGTAELIWLLAQAFVKPGDGVCIIGPTFGEYRRAASQVGAVIKEITAQSPDFDPPLDIAEEYIGQHHPRMVFLCNPNNPTGKNMDAKRIGILQAACGTETILVLDEAYRSFVNGVSFGGLPGSNCILLRSMTKEFALAGLRLGYAIADVRFVEKMKSIQPAWSVNAFAQAGGLAALSDLEYYQRTLAALRQLSQEFHQNLKVNGFGVVQSDVNYALVNFSFPVRDLRRKLLGACIQVRDCTSFGLPDCIRISTGLETDNQKLLEGLLLWTNVI